MSAAAQAKNPKDKLKALVETERAFSRTSEEKGIRESFAEFIADDGILFRPTAVPGKKWMQEHPLPPSTTRPLLTWQPIFVAISRAGDLGYTTGPWQFKNDIKDAKPAAFGNFMTIWKKQPNGDWRFVLDLGITNPEPKAQAKLTYAAPPAGRSPRIDRARAREDLLNEEREFSKASADLGAVEAFLFNADVGVRLFRNNKMPFVGRRAGATALTPLSKEWTWTPAFADVSVSGDLGYSYGTYQLRDKAAGSITETGNYARVWKKVAGLWRVVIDVADPLPKN
jgi:ketosteroid isomerase-like protein